MRKAFIFCIVLIASSCQFTKEKKAQHIIRKYLSEHLNDPSSYESVSFTKLDTNKSNYILTGGYDSIESHITKIEIGISDAKMNLQYPDLYNSKKLRIILRQLKRDSIVYAIKKDSLEKNFQEKQIGWTIKHTYRAKNGFGGLGLHSTMFTLNITCDSVIDVYEIKD